MKLLIVKLSSLGDVVHAMPAVQDLRQALPQARIDWVVERGFSPLVGRCAGVNRVIDCELRRWRKAPWSASTWAGWQRFRQQLRAEAYDAVIDLHGLTKSALVAWMASLAPGGRRLALAHQTDGSSYEAPTRWVADEAIAVEPHIHAVDRSRELCARAFGYAVPSDLRFGLLAHAELAASGDLPCVVLVHGTSRADKCWPDDHWVELGLRLIEVGYRIALPHGNDAERQRSELLARVLGPRASVWPRLELGALTDRLATCAGVVGVDSGLSHIAVALDLPHVQVYNFDTAWRTGPQGQARQISVFAEPTPSVEAVWAGWQQVAAT